MMNRKRKKSGEFVDILFRNMWETVPKRGKWMQKKIDYF